VNMLKAVGGIVLAAPLGPFVIVLPFGIVAESLHSSEPTFSNFVLLTGWFLWFVVVTYLLLRALRLWRAGW
jgi:hypothetical protein